MDRYKAVVWVIAGLFASGCAGSATHDVVTAYQANDGSLSCSQITSEMMKAQFVIDGVNRDKEDWTAADITDGLLWFPFNLIAKDANYRDALEAGNQRIARLTELEKEKNCRTVAAEPSVKRATKVAAQQERQLLGPEIKPVLARNTLDAFKSENDPLIKRDNTIAMPPAEYKPLPVGTRVTYDTWGYTVTKTEGFDITFKTTAGNWKHYYAVFGKYGDNVYLSGGCIYDCEDWKSDLDAGSRAALETIWPLKVGKKVKLNSEESKSGYSGFPKSRPWTVALEVVRAEILELNGLLYSTYVIEEHAVSEGTVGQGAAGPEGYSETIWYDPGSGLVLKSVKEMTRGPQKGDWQEYSLVRVRLP